MPAVRIRVGLVVKPLMSGLRYNSRIPARSAPSAKILTFKSARLDIGSAPFEVRSYPLNFYARCGEVVHYVFTASLVAALPRWEAGSERIQAAAVARSAAIW